MKRRVHTKFLGICMPQSMYDQITKLSDECNSSKSELVRILIQAQLNIIEKEENTYEQQ